VSAIGKLVHGYDLRSAAWCAALLARQYTSGENDRSGRRLRRSATAHRARADAEAGIGGSAQLRCPQRQRSADVSGEHTRHRQLVAALRGGQAASGYALVRSIALPLYDSLRLNGVREEAALLQVLLHLLAINPDTNLASRGGLAGLDYVRAYASRVLSEGGALAPDGVEKMAAFDDALIARNLSPGGTADLLGVTWFLAQLPTNTRRIGEQRRGIGNMEHFNSIERDL